MQKEIKCAQYRFLPGLMKIYVRALSTNDSEYINN